VEFEQWFREKSRWFEKILLRAVVLFLVLLVAAQLLQTIPEARRVLSLVDRLEGVPYQAPEEPAFSRTPVAPDGHYLVLKVNDKPENSLLQVLVNGQAVADFNETSTVTVSVRDGDMVELDGDLPEQEINVLISAVSSDIVSPVSGKEIRFFGLTEIVGWVRTGD
jgi:hypothetical protein